jgi:Bacterial Ig-like domain
LVVTSRGIVKGLTLTFSQPMDAATVQNMDNYSLAFELLDGSGVGELAPLRSVLYDAATQTAQVTFAAPLNQKRSYNLFVDYLKDAAGNGFDDPITQSDEFQTDFQFGHTLKAQNLLLGVIDPVEDGLAIWFGLMNGLCVRRIALGSRADRLRSDSATRQGLIWRYIALSFPFFPLADRSPRLSRHANFRTPTRLEISNPLSAIIPCESGRFSLVVAAKMKAGSLHSRSTKREHIPRKLMTRVRGDK